MFELHRSAPGRRAMLAALALLASAACAGAQDHSTHAAPAADAHAGHAAPAGTPSAAYMDAMHGMDRAMQRMPMTGDAGGDYARMMIPHHRSAVEMARAYLASADRDPALVRLSDEIVASQEREIEILERWLRENPGR